MCWPHRNEPHWNCNPTHLGRLLGIFVIPHDSPLPFFFFCSFVTINKSLCPSTHRVHMVFSMFKNVSSRNKLDLRRHQFCISSVRAKEGKQEEVRWQLAHSGLVANQNLSNLFIYQCSLRLFLEVYSKQEGSPYCESASCPSTALLLLWWPPNYHPVCDCTCRIVSPLCLKRGSLPDIDHNDEAVKVIQQIPGRYREL